MRSRMLRSPYRKLTIASGVCQLVQNPVRIILPGCFERKQLTVHSIPDYRRQPADRRRQTRHAKPARLGKYDAEGLGARWHDEEMTAGIEFVQPQPILGR